MSLYLDDLQIGQQFQSRVYELSTEAVKAFAEQFDPQPFHLDENAAEQSFFNGLAASGWHTSAIAMRLMVESIPIAGGLIGAGLEELRWLKPVRPNDSLHLVCEILTIRKARSQPTKGIVRVGHTLFNQHNEPVEKFISTIVVPSANS
jgi:acyl dehydratase